MTEVKYIGGAGLAYYYPELDTIYLSHRLQDSKMEKIKDYLLQHEIKHAKVLLPDNLTVKNCLKYSYMQAKIDYKEVGDRPLFMVKHMYFTKANKVERYFNLMGLFYMIMTLGCIPIECGNWVKLLANYVKAKVGIK